MEWILETERQQIKNVTLQLWFSVSCSLYSRLYNEPRLAPLIPRCPSACVLQNIVPIQRRSFTQKHTHIHVYTHSFGANKCRGSLSPEAMAFSKRSSEWNQSDSANEAWWTATLLLLFASHSHSLSACFTPFPVLSLSLNTLGLIVCHWLKLSQASSQHCCCLEKEHCSVSVLRRCLICTDRRSKTSENLVSQPVH